MSNTISRKINTLLIKKIEISLSMILSLKNTLIYRKIPTKLHATFQEDREYKNYLDIKCFEVIHIKLKKNNIKAYLEDAFKELYIGSILKRKFPISSL